MKPFASNEDFFAAVRALAAKLDARGEPRAAAALRDGFAHLNGLTDGCAAFLEAVDGIRADPAHRLDREERRALASIRAALRRAVRRR